MGKTTIQRTKKLIGAMTMNKKIIEAINYAITKHGNARRKDNTPYITHPLAVMNILLEEQAHDNSITDDVIIAGICHDLNEDANVSIKELSEKFGTEVARLVQAVSEPEQLKKDPDKKGTWKQRKEHAITMMQQSEKNVKLIFCADKLDNIRSIHKDLTLGVNIWSKFNAPKTEILWYYDTALKALVEGNAITHSRAYKLFKETVQAVKNKQDKP